MFRQRHPTDRQMDINRVQVLRENRQTQTGSTSSLNLEHTDRIRCPTITERGNPREIVPRETKTQHDDDILQTKIDDQRIDIFDIGN